MNIFLAEEKTSEDTKMNVKMKNSHVSSVQGLSPI